MKRETAREDVPRVRVRGPGARLQGRSHARAVSDRARQDSPESIVRDVRATPAPARHGDQAGAPARPAALHQGVRRLSRWRLAVGVLLFAALAPLSLVALPLAALLVAARPATRGEWVAVALAGGAGVALLAGPENGVFDALTRTWIVLVTVAFAASARLSRKGFWPLALRACLYAAAGVTVLVAWSRAGPGLWTEVQWEATRDASRAMRYVVEVAPGLYPAFEPAVRLLAAWPLWLVVESLVGLALAWRSHAVIARDRKSTRLNSSHGYISYAVFCLKKKKKYEPLMNDAEQR